MRSFPYVYVPDTDVFSDSTNTNLQSGYVRLVEALSLVAHTLTPVDKIKMVNNHL